MTKNIIGTLAILTILSIGILEAQTLKKGKIKLTAVTDSPLFPNSTLVLSEPTSETTIVKNGQDSASVKFQYKVANFTLTDQTSDAKEKHCSNSAKGQHIHLILNNAPYIAKYDSSFSFTLKEGNYVALSFLSRSYHESLKHSTAYVLSQFTVGTPAEGVKRIDEKSPLLFYSRPKGEYVGEDTKKVLLDFYLVNCSLSKTGYKVKATINGKVFILTEWKAYAMEGLPMGETTITLELLDKDNAVVKSAYSSSTRKITLK